MKKWLKDIAIDLLVTVVIIFALLSEVKFLEYVVVGYTGLMLIIRLLVLFNPDVLKRMKKMQPPIWIFHLLYGINTVALLAFGWWATGAMWALIWLLSLITHRKLNVLKPKKRAKSSKR